MIPFRRMNGLGNRFAVVDTRARPFEPAAETLRRLADPHVLGFDQFILIAPPEAPSCDATMRIFNADGGEVESCGNAARCIAALLIEETGAPTVTLGSRGGAMRAWRSRAADGATADLVTVDMGVPRFEAADVPLAPGAGPAEALTFAEPELAAFGPAACVNVGNPHAVFFVSALEAVPLARVGPQLEHHAAFPERANISFVETIAPTHVRAIVHERGVGPTRACGTAACAVAAVGEHLGRLASPVTVELPGGALTIEIVEGRILMTGPYALDGMGWLDGERVILE